MKHRSKSDILYDSLRTQILSGQLKAGSRLPNENVLAEQLHVSRWTLRQTLAQLEQEELLLRVQKKGTVVTTRSQQPLISILVPCPDYILRAGPTNSRAHLELLCGVSLAIRESACRVETLAVSLSNQSQEIDWIKLNHLHADSMVIVLGWWYTPIFELLLRKQCRVVMIECEPAKAERYQSFLAHWHHIALERQAAFQQATALLEHAGCQDIVVIGRGETSSVAGATVRLRHVELPAESDCGVKLAIAAVRQAYRESPFDGLLIDALDWLRPYPQADYHRLLGIPSSVRLVVAQELPENNECRIPLTSFEFPHRQLGFQAAQLLQQREIASGHQKCRAVFFERESSRPLGKNKNRT